MMKDTGIKIFDARNQADVRSVNSPLIFINGGRERPGLIRAINNDKKILNLILNADYIVSESSGSMVTAEFMREGKGGGKITQGLGIIKDSIIEPHYSERSYQQLLIDEMKQTKANYGIGIDCTTAIVVDPIEFPQKWDKIGNGLVDVKIAQ